MGTAYFLKRLVKLVANPSMKQRNQLPIFQLRIDQKVLIVVWFRVMFRFESIQMSSLPQMNSSQQMIEPSTVAPLDMWLAALCQTTIEVFSIMVGAAVTGPGDPTLAVQSHMTGVVGIGGAVQAVFSLRCSSESAGKIAAQMLGISPDDLGSQKAAADAVGEVCNIVAGYFKAKIGLGEKCMLSVPTIVTGGDYKIHSGTAGQRLEFPVIYEGEPIWIALDIRQ